MQENFENQLINSFPYPPTEGQGHLLHAFARFLFSTKPRCTLLVKGYAGTGKTTVTGAVVKTLKQFHYNVALMAPTGRAAKVLSSFSDHPAFTIHRTIYVKKAKAGNVSFGLAPNLKKNTVFLVDEASMIGESTSMQGEQSFEYRDLLEDLMEFVFSGVNCRLVLIGDGAQLPPVGSDESPALKAKDLERNFGLTIAELELTEVVRQELDSGILFNANTLRQQILLGKEGFPNLSAEGFPDMKIINGEELQDVLEDLYGRLGQENVAVITRSNKRANQFNQQIRARILWKEEEIAAGDMLMVVRNNYYWLEEYKDAPTAFIANGDSLEIQKITKYHEMYGYKFADVVVKMVDFPEFPAIEVRIILDSLNIDQANLGMGAQRNLYALVGEDYADLSSRRKIHEAISKDPFYNALQVKFAYAITCHKSQGGQWPAVIVDQGFLTEEMLDVSLLRWFYTAFTRAQKELYLLNFSKSFFAD
ncbi:MAG: exodeoxyribonuclease-5 [Flavobacteriales bacterium]|jgi:exodeoxyribonuclease-5